MAYLYEEKKKSGRYLVICESNRGSGKSPKRKRLYRLGKVEDYSSEELKRIAKQLYVLGGGRIEDLLIHTNVPMGL